MSAGFALICATGAFDFLDARHDAALLLVAQAERLRHGRHASSRAFFSENLAGSVWLSAGAPGTASLPLTKMSVLAARRMRAGLFLAALLRLDRIVALRIGRLLGRRDADAQPDVERRGGERQMDEAHGRNS